MDEIATTMHGWRSDPTIGKLLTLVIGVLLVATIVRVANRSLARLVKDSEARYRTRKLVSFGG